MIRIKFLSMITAAGLVSSAAAEDQVIRALGNHGGECKVCQPVTETKKVSKRVYTSVCEDFCLPKGSFLAGLIGSSDCGECKEAKCGQVRTKKFLVVKIRTTEECVTKCVPKPACEQPVIISQPALMPLPAKP
jgi:hypothetical protein